MAPDAHSSLLDDSFYQQFAAATALRLAGIGADISAHLRGEVSYAALLEAVKLPLHNMVGEARLLELRDIANYLSRLSRTLGRLGQPVGVPLSADRLTLVVRGCGALAGVIGVEVRDARGIDGTGRQEVEAILGALAEGG